MKALADRTRRRIVGLLRDHELSVSELVEVLAQPQSTVSRHLRVLREAGLLRDRRDGVTVHYRLVRSPDPGVPTASDSNKFAPEINDEDELSRRVVEWITQQAVPASMRERLTGVVEARADKSRRFFDRVGRHWDSIREASFGPWFHLEAFLSLLPRDWSVLDVGTGTGYLLAALSRQFASVIGVEPAETMLGVARRRVDSLRLDNVELRPGEVAALPIEHGSIDLVLAVLVLHHVPAPAEALRELHRVLRPEGRLLVVEQTTHDNSDFRERMQDPRSGFDPAELSEWTTKAGFEDTTVRPLATVVRSDDAPELFVMTAKAAVQA